MLDAMIFRGNCFDDAIDYIYKKLENEFENDTRFEVRKVGDKIKVEFTRRDEKTFEISTIDTITFNYLIRVDNTVLCYLSDKDMKRIDTLDDCVKEAVLELLRFAK